jgi:cytochrome c-type biogenesis protein CcmE
MSGSRRSAKPLVIAGVIVIVAVFGYLLYGGLDKNVVYFLTPKELLAKGTKAALVQSSPARLTGITRLSI